MGIQLLLFGIFSFVAIIVELFRISGWDVDKLEQVQFNLDVKQLFFINAMFMSSILMIVAGAVLTAMGV